MNSKEENFNPDNIQEPNLSSKTESISSENINDTNKSSSEVIVDEKSNEIEDTYKFGWSIYSEITNGRFAMLGFLAIILIELLSHQSFLKWAGIL